MMRFLLCFVLLTFAAAAEDCQAGIVSLTSSSSSSELREKPVFKNVRIEENTVEGGAGPQLVVSSAQGIVIRGNRFLSPQHDAPPDTGASYGIGKDAVIWISKCREVVNEGNAVEDVGSFAGEAVQIQK